MVKPIELSEKLVALLKEQPYFYSDLLRKFTEVDYRTFLLGWSELRTRHELDRDEEGRYLMKS
jgi:hypothetical protein